MTFRPLTPVDFYPRPPRGGRRAPQALPLEARPFLSTPSARRATSAAGAPSGSQTISIHALREEGDSVRGKSHRASRISIHALREEGDRRRSATGRHIQRISIHALREEGDVLRFALRTPRLYFYPRPPRGGRRAGNISLFDKTLFLSTPSARRATS